MPSRSGMAVALILALGGRHGAAQDAPPQVRNAVRLQLQITGLAPDGCMLRIAPSHPGCRIGELPDDLNDPDTRKLLKGEGPAHFAPIERRIDTRGVTGGMVRLKPINVLAQSMSADRDCSFAITITEPGQPPRTYHRGLRLMVGSASQLPEPQSLKVYLTAPSVAARDDAAQTKKR